MGVRFFGSKAFCSGLQILDLEGLGYPMRGCFPESLNSSDGKKIR